MTDTRDFVPSGFFALRTPLQPFDTLLAWGAELAAPGAAAGEREAALAADRRVLRERLRELLARAEVREAVFVASPSLEESLPHWLEAPDGERGQKVERSLARYLGRMSGRSTPFGLFAGCSVGTLGEATRLELPERARYARHTRLDMDYVLALADTLARLPELRRALPHRPNSSLYALAGQWRYAESRLVGKARSYHLVAVERTDYLDATLANAASGARPAALAETLAALAEVELDEAAGFVDELCDSQLLVPELAPPVTGPEPVHGMAELLRSTDAGAELAVRLDGAQRAIEALDAAGVGNSPEAYRAIARGLEALPTKVELPRLFQVDMVKPAAHASLGPAVVEELARAIELLRKITPTPSPRTMSERTALGRFKEAFRERYEDREVPLTEALDEDGGIGFDKGSDAGAEGSPLLEGLAFPGRGAGDEGGARWTGREQHLLRRLMKRGAGAEAGVSEDFVLGDDDVKALTAAGEKAPLPDAFSIMATLAAASPEALAAGDFQLLVRGGSGPSGANLLGRFCHGDPELEALVRGHIAAEEALRPEAIFAELVHLPEGRVGNVLARPVLRGWEIPYLGRSGAGHEQQISVDDLMVSLRGDRVVLRSRRLNKEVLPRLTTAHNFSSPRNLGLYRFLCEVPSQGSFGVPGWTWGALESLESLPRVRMGRLVLARARWRLSRTRLEGITKAKDARARFDAAQALRAELSWPRFVEAADGDNELPVDLDNLLSIETFAHLVKERGEVELVEMWPPPASLCVHGPEGSFTHELVVPFTRPARAPGATSAEAAAPRPVAAVAPRRFPPGSEWLYAKIYLGPGYGDRVLREAIAPVVAHALGSGAADSWFFIRYGDPGWHLRVRFHGDPARLRADVEPALAEALAPQLARGGVHRVVFDTYEREVERYGGDVAMAIGERLFRADSDAALALIEHLSGDGAADARWRLALRGMDQLLGDLGFDLAGKLAVLKATRTSFGREFGVSGPVEKQLGDKFRKQRAELDTLLDRDKDAASPLNEILPAFTKRSEAMVSVAEELRAANVPLENVAGSYLHMHANRLLRSAARPQELVIYDFLVRLYESRVARAKKKGGGAGS
jgi:thiopeptide-type bacteriocin biosynthesis protein